MPATIETISQQQSLAVLRHLNERPLIKGATNSITLKDLSRIARRELTSSEAREFLGSYASQDPSKSDSDDIEVNRAGLTLFANKPQTETKIGGNSRF